MTVGENIKRIRKEKSLTQKQLGGLCEPRISESTIRKYELGILNPKIETVKKIAMALNEPLSHLLPWEEYTQSEEFKESERKVNSHYAIIKILEELYNRAELISVDAYNKGELNYCSDYISLGTEPNKISINNSQFDKICEQIKLLLKTSIELIAQNEDTMLNEWINESDVDVLQTSELEHVIIKCKDNKQNKKYTKPVKSTQI